LALRGFLGTSKALTLIELSSCETVALVGVEGKTRNGVLGAEGIPPCFGKMLVGTVTPSTVSVEVGGGGGGGTEVPSESSVEMV